MRSLVFVEDLVQVSLGDFEGLHHGLVNGIKQTFNLGGGSSL
jgi:hypothetical protein